MNFDTDTLKRIAVLVHEGTIDSPESLNKLYSVVDSDGERVSDFYTSSETLKETEGELEEGNKVIVTDPTTEEDVDEFLDAQDVTTQSYGDYVNSSEAEYRVFEGYDAAVAAAVESVEELIDDVGVFGLSDYVNNYIIPKNLDESWFKVWYEEDSYNYAEDIKEESSNDDDLYVNRLHEEMVELDVVDDLDSFNGDRTKAEDAVEQSIDDFVEKRVNEIDDFVETFEFNFGVDELNSVVVQNNLVDINAVASEVVDIDGPAHTLASYDGDENYVTIEGTDFYIFRTN